MTRILRARATHLYPGARGLGTLADGPCQIAFADGVQVPATLSGDTLTVAAHRTAKGAAIPPKRWRIATEGEGWRILARLPDDPSGA